MQRIDFTPLYRSTVGFDRFANLLDSALQNNQSGSSYPPYDIEVLDENRYAIRLALAGFEEQELSIEVEKGVLTISGKKAGEDDDSRYLYRGIANRSFERKFQLADHVEVESATFHNGLLEVRLLKELPEAMKPRRISIGSSRPALESDVEDAA
jgi:molecular chaperone IbpA